MERENIITNTYLWTFFYITGNTVCIKKARQLPTFPL